MIDYTGPVNVRAEIETYYTDRGLKKATFIVPFKVQSGAWYFALSFTHLQREDGDAYTYLLEYIKPSEPIDDRTENPPGLLRGYKPVVGAVCRHCGSQEFIGHQGRRWMVVHCKECKKRVVKVSTPEYCTPLGLEVGSALLGAAL